MRQSLEILMAGAAGLALGWLYFGSLWWTVQRLAAARQPAALLLASYSARVAVVVVGVLLVGSGEWTRLAGCLVGFVLARVITCRVFQPSHEPSRQASVSEG